MVEEETKAALEAHTLAQQHLQLCVMGVGGQLFVLLLTMDHHCVDEAEGDKRAITLSQLRTLQRNAHVTRMYCMLHSTHTCTILDQIDKCCVQLEARSKGDIVETIEVGTFIEKNIPTFTYASMNETILAAFSIYDQEKCKSTNILHRTIDKAMSEFFTKQK